MEIKQKLFEALKTKYSDLGFSKEVLEGVATQLSTFITEEKDIATAVAGSETMHNERTQEQIADIKKRWEERQQRDPFS